MVNENVTDEDIERITKTIDPDGTFLDECERVVEERFGKKALQEVRER